jgi:hypothetical protein
LHAAGPALGQGSSARLPVVDHEREGRARCDLSDHLPVGRYIVIAQSWPERLVPRKVEGIAIELWTYPAPALWTGPGTERRVDPAT